MCMCVSVCMFVRIWTCIHMHAHTHTHTHELGRLAGFTLHPQLNNVLCSHFHNSGHFTTPRTCYAGCRPSPYQWNTQCSCHLFGCQVLHQMLLTHYLVYSCNNPRIRLTDEETEACGSQWTCSYTPGMGQPRAQNLGPN